MEDNNDQFVLDICYLKSDAEVKNYFNKLIRADLDIHDEQLISINILKYYCFFSKNVYNNIHDTTD